jgi:hypothetical protein
VYGTGGFKDAGVIDSGVVPEAGKGEAGPGLDTLLSEAGAADASDAKEVAAPEVHFDE